MPIYWGTAGSPWWFAWVVVGAAYLMYSAYSYQGCGGDQACIAAINQYCANGGCF